jgi:hypothetical protein
MTSSGHFHAANRPGMPGFAWGTNWGLRTEAVTGTFRAETVKAQIRAYAGDEGRTIPDGM